MEVGVLRIFGEVAGTGGLILGLSLFLFRDIIRKNVFPKLSQDKAFRLLRFIASAVWSVAILGIGSWIYVSQLPDCSNYSNARAAGGAGGKIDIKIGQAVGFNAELSAHGGNSDHGPGGAGGNISVEIGDSKNSLINTSAEGGSALSKRWCK